MCIMKEKAVDFYVNKGYSCAESVIKAASEEGLCPRELLSCATAFSGGMASGCVCGAVAAAQIVNGYNFGRENSKCNEVLARENAAKIVEEFKKRNKVTCCRVLSKGFEGAERKAHCSKFVSDACDILEQLFKVKV